VIREMSVKELGQPEGFCRHHNECGAIPITGWMKNAIG
jgi:hypothetical protein